MQKNIDELREDYLRLINEDLPKLMRTPVRLNSSFSRVVLDWLCQGVWYERIARPAYKHLQPDELARCIERMQKWINNPEILWRDNAKSLEYRRLQLRSNPSRSQTKKFTNRLLFH